MAKRSSQNEEIEVLEDRIIDIEDMLAKLVEGRFNSKDTHQTGETTSCCALPRVPPRPRAPSVSDYRESLISYTQKKWVNGTKLQYYFFTEQRLGGHATNLNMVRQAFKVWEGLGIGIEFEETKTISQAELRIAFQPNIGSWSYVGTDNLRYPGQNEPTMNFGWDLRNDSRGLDTPIHEIGHALGFPHEHQNQFAGIVWDQAEVIRYFSGPPNNWDLDTIKRNILNKHSASIVSGSAWDPNSIMHYSFGPGLILQPPEFQNGLTPAPGLSDIDKSEALKFYPAIKMPDLHALNPMVTEILDLKSAEQVNFRLNPEETRDYTIRTIGDSDTLLVLFRKDDNENVYMKGSDDGGLDENATIVTRLERGQSYILRVRVLSSYEGGSAAVIYW